MAAFLALLNLYTICTCIFPAVVSIQATEQTQRWGKVRPARVLDINDTIYVRVVPHTHDDVGWLETVDEYYYGGITIVMYARII